MPKGKVYDKRAMFLQQHVGDAEAANGDKYDIGVCLTSGRPLVRSKKTEKTWSIGLGELIDMAIEAGIDEPDEAQEVRHA